MADRKGFFEIRPQLNFEDISGKFIHPDRYEMPQFSYRILRIKKEGTKNG